MKVNFFLEKLKIVCCEKKIKHAKNRNLLEKESSN